MYSTSALISKVLAHLAYAYTRAQSTSFALMQNMLEKATTDLNPVSN